MDLVCSDLEGVFIPEIWINVAYKTGIEELKLTTRDISDYDVLMKKRLSIMDTHGLKLKDITDVIATMDPLPGAYEFVKWAKSSYPFIILSDTFEQFAGPLMEKLEWPTLLCHTLKIDGSDRIVDYVLRQPDQKFHAVTAFKGLNYRVVAFGDSYNDIGMLHAADQGILFCPPDNVIDEFPEFPVTVDYNRLKEEIEKAFSK